jgi:hypothetical protein
MRLPLELSLPSASTSPSPSVVIDPDSGELLLLELQGELELQGDVGDDSEAATSAGARVGKLDLSIAVRVNSLGPAQSAGKADFEILTDAQSRPTLLIGHHRLVGKVVNLNTPIAILRHTLPPKIATPGSALLPPPPSSSPLKRARSSSPPAEADLAEDDAADDESPAKRIHVSKGQESQPDIQAQTPQPARIHSLNKQSNNANNGATSASSPLLAPPGPSSSATSARTLPPQTPINVTELKQGKHEIVGILKKKIVFSKRPEPIVKLDPLSDDEA